MSLQPVPTSDGLTVVCAVVRMMQTSSPRIARPARHPFRHATLASCRAFPPPFREGQVGEAHAAGPCFSE